MHTCTGCFGENDMFHLFHPPRTRINVCPPTDLISPSVYLHTTMTVRKWCQTPADARADFTPKSWSGECVKMEECVTLVWLILDSAVSPSLSLLSYQFYSAVILCRIILSKLTACFQFSPWSKVHLLGKGTSFLPRLSPISYFLFLSLSFFLTFHFSPPTSSPSLSLQYISVSARGEEKKWSRQEIYPVERQVWINKEEVYSALPEREGWRETREGFFIFFFCFFSSFP